MGTRYPKDARTVVLQCSHYGYTYKANTWYGGTDYTCYVYATDPDPLSYPIMMGYDEDWLDEWSRGYVQWDISPIPPGSVILTAGIRLYLAYDGQWSDEWDDPWTYIHFFSMENDIRGWLGSSNSETLWNDAYDGYLMVDDGPFYAQMDPQYNTWWPSDSGWLVLNQNAINILQSAVNSGRDWFGISIVQYSNEYNDGGVNFFGEQSYLYIAYLPPNQPVLYDPDYYPERDTVGGYFTFLIHYFDEWEYPPQVIYLTLVYPDGTKTNYDLYLLQGNYSDGIYGTRLNLYQLGTYQLAFYAINTNGVSASFPEEGFILGPTVVADTMELYNPQVELVEPGDTIYNVDDLIRISINYRANFTLCDSILAIIKMLDPYNKENDSTLHRLNLISGDSLYGCWAGEYVLHECGQVGIYFLSFMGNRRLRYPNDGSYILFDVFNASVREGSSKNTLWEVYDVIGRKVADVETLSAMKNMKFLKSGIYFLKQKGSNRVIKHIVFE